MRLVFAGIVLGFALAAEAAAQEPFYVLALSWQPAFCETQPGKLECQEQRLNSFEATHLSLHGLWPQPRRVAYCGVARQLIGLDDAGQWEDLPAPVVSSGTRTALERAMPGTHSFLERHEWIKHGSCYGDGSAETYFKDALRITDAINASPVRAFLASNIGLVVSASDLRARFDEGFGKGAGKRVRVSCKRDQGRQMIVEITLGLRGNISAGTPVSQLIAAAPPTEPGCPEGIVDPVGLQ